MQNITIGFIGGGNMASAIISGLKSNHFAMQNITVVEPDADKRSLLSAQYQIHTSAQIAEISQCNVIILAVKPQQLSAVCQALSEKITTSQPLIISIAAGIRATDISRWLSGYKSIVRVMPNTPAQIQSGISALFALDQVPAQARDTAAFILEAVGKTVWLSKEEEMDAVTAISGSGPAYVFLMIEALQEAAVKLGLSTENARILALETFAGASKLAAQSDTDIKTLRAQVTSKGGTTEQGVLVLEQAEVRETIYLAAKAAQEKSVILGDALGSES